MKRSLILIACLAGCQPKDDDQRIVRPAEYEFMLVFAIDPGSKFQQSRWADPAHRFMEASIRNYFRDRSEASDRVLLVKLADDPLLWQGRPQGFMKEFPTPQELRSLFKDAEPSRPFSATALTLDYLSDLPQVKSGNAKVLVVVISDMMAEKQTSSNVPDPSRTSECNATAQAKFSDALRRFCKFHHEICFMWVDLRAVPDVKRCFRDAGLPEPPFQLMEKDPDPLHF